VPENIAKSDDKGIPYRTFSCDAYEILFLSASVAASFAPKHSLSFVINNIFYRSDK